MGKRQLGRQRGVCVEPRFRQAGQRRLGRIEGICRARLIGGHSATNEIIVHLAFKRPEQLERAVHVLPQGKRGGRHVQFPLPVKEGGGFGHEPFRAGKIRAPLPACIFRPSGGLHHIDNETPNVLIQFRPVGQHTVAVEGSQRDGTHDFGHILPIQACGFWSAPAAQDAAGRSQEPPALVRVAPDAREGKILPSLRKN